ncbi:GntR family transcriptional regulator [Roseovarius sp.]|uniref:GntR family transcriptional regulator n=1 Tax=Roseovarius sp. TaxID=1486281 RepID=UPI00356A9D33
MTLAERSQWKDEGSDESRNASLAHIAYTQLEEMLVTLSLRPGSLVREAELCESLGIGRTPVREALKHLERDGLIEIQPRRGIWVTEIDIRRELLALEVRRPLEKLVCGRAARRRTASEAAKFGKIGRDLRATAETGDGPLFMRLDAEFNMLVCQAARNPSAAEALVVLQTRSRRFWYTRVTTGLDLVRAARHHADVAEAIRDGDEPGAEDSAERLIDYVEEFLRASITVGI